MVQQHFLIRDEESNIELLECMLIFKSEFGIQFYYFNVTEALYIHEI
jgi:hypothetical protein